MYCDHLMVPFLDPVGKSLLLTASFRMSGRLSYKFYNTVTILKTSLYRRGQRCSPGTVQKLPKGVEKRGIISLYFR